MRYWQVGVPPDPIIQAFGLYISYTLGMPATTVQSYPRIDADRLMRKIMDLANIGAIDGGGCARLALTDEDAAGRDLVVAWMHELGLTVTTDVIGNVIGTWNIGRGLPVMTGSHIDTVRTGGKDHALLQTCSALLFMWADLLLKKHSTLLVLMAHA